MYNPYQNSGPFGRPPEFGGFPGAPGITPPPGTLAPGTAPASGPQPNNAQQPGFAGGFPPNFQPPANMPNINFSAPVIRLGTTGTGKPSTPLEGGRGDRDAGGRRAGLGAGMGDYQRQDRRENATPLVPQTREEIIRTVFVGGITEGTGGDAGIERILRTAGNLRRWTRATDADDKPCKFGFAEFEDPESLHTAVEVLQDVEVPVKRQMPKAANGQATGDESEKGENGDNAGDDEVETSKLIIIADDNTRTYLQKWEDSQGGLDEAHTEMRLDQARSALAAVLNDLTHPSVVVQKDDLSGIDRDGDTAMGERANGDSAEVITIPIAIEDELSDIPAEMRETVAKEIAAFRDRSNRRDLERLRREEEIEAMERNRGAGRNRLASPPDSAPTGPGAGSNGIPLGPRDKSVPNAPAGPKAFGQQIPRDYQKGVSFVNGAGVNGSEDEDTDASDEELERRRKEKRNSELGKQYLDQERRWLNRERSRTAAVEREKNRDAEEATRLNTEKEAMAKRLREWNDDAEAAQKREEYYQDRSLWIRNRASFRSREVALDEADRIAEAREKARDHQQRERAAGMADDFLNRQAEELEQQTPHQQQQQPAARFKLSLGAAAAAKAQDRANAAATTRARRTNAAEVEGLLEDEEESAATARRTLIPIDPSTLSSLATASGGGGADMTDEERTAAARQLAADIPTDKGGLWAWPVRWDFVDEAVISEQLRPFVEKKIVEYLGVLEGMLVEVVESHLRKRGSATDLVDELEGALGDEEAETLVKKLWRMVIFFSESEGRGLNG